MNKYIFTIICFVCSLHAWSKKHWVNDFLEVEKKIELGQYKEAIGSCSKITSNSKYSTIQRNAYGFLKAYAASQLFDFKEQPDTLLLNEFLTNYKPDFENDLSVYAVVLYYDQIGQYVKSQKVLSRLKQESTNSTLLLQYIQIKNSIHLGYYHQSDSLVKHLSNKLNEMYASKVYVGFESLVDPNAYIKELVANTLIMDVEISYASGNMKQSIVKANEVEAKIKKYDYIKSNAGRQLYWIKGKAFEGLQNWEEAANWYKEAYGIGTYMQREEFQVEILEDLLNAYIELDQPIQYQSYKKRLQMHSDRTLKEEDRTKIVYEYAMCKHLFSHELYLESQKRVDELAKFATFLPTGHKYLIQIGLLQYQIHLAIGSFTQASNYYNGFMKDAEISFGTSAPEYHRLNLTYLEYLVQYGSDYTKGNQLEKVSYNQFVKKELYASSKEMIQIQTYLSQLLRNQNRYAEAEQYSKVALKEAEETYGVNSLYYIEEKINLCNLWIERGNYIDVYNELPAIEEVLKQTKENTNIHYLETLVSYTALLMEMGEVERAKKYGAPLLKLKRSFVGFEPMQLANWKTKLGELYLTIGEYNSAQLQLKEALDLKYSTEKTYNKNCLENFLKLALVSLELGEYKNTESYLSQAKKIATEFYGEASLTNVQIEEVNVKYFIHIGAYSKAEKSLLSIISKYEKTFSSEHIKIAFLGNELALVKALSGFKDLLYYQQAFAKNNKSVQAQFTNKHPIYAEQLLIQAKIYELLKEDTKAYQLVLEAEGIYKNTYGENSVQLANCYHLEAKSLMNLNKLTEAKTQIQKSKSIYKNAYSDTHEGYVDAQSLEARVYYLQGDNDNALDLMTKSNEQYLNFVTNYFPSLSENEKSNYWNKIRPQVDFYNFMCYQMHKQKPELIGSLYNNVIATKAILLSNSKRIKEQILNSGDTSLIQLYIDYVSSKELLTMSLGLSKEELINQHIDINQLETHIESVEKSLSEKSTAFANSKQMAVDWKMIRSVLKPTEFAVEMVRIKHAHPKYADSIVYVALINSTADENQPKLVTYPFGSSLDGKWIKYYRNSVIYNFDDKYSYDRFYKPLKQNIPDGATVYFSAEGVFNQLNLELIKTSTSTYAFDQNYFINVSNTKDLIKTLTTKASDKSKEKKVTNKNYWFIGGAPTFYEGNEIAIENRSVKNLPGAAKEVEMLDSMLLKLAINPIYKTGDSLTEEYVKTIENPKVFHIATHGYFKASDDNENEDGLIHNPLLNSGLLLVGSGNLLDDPANTYINAHDGVLTAYEVMNLNFDKTELVTLSACETGLGSVKIGEGVYGLQRAFLIAGADAIIMSLFKVNDDVTIELMNVFYTQWKVTGDKRLAFYQAKKQIKEKYKEPKLWGAFVMIVNE